MCFIWRTELIFLSPAEASWLFEVCMCHCGSVHHSRFLKHYSNYVWINFVTSGKLSRQLLGQPLSEQENMLHFRQEKSFGIASFRNSGCVWSVSVRCVCIVASQAAMTLLSVAPMLSGGKSPHPKQHRLQGALSITVERLLFSNLQIQIPSFYRSNAFVRLNLLILWELEGTDSSIVGYCP